MSRSTEPDEQNRPTQVEIQIAVGAILLGGILGFFYSSILLGVLVWFLSTAFGLELNKAILKVGLRQAPRELAERLYSRLRKELGSEAEPTLAACRTCGHPVAQSAMSCPLCGTTRPALSSIQRGIKGIESVCLWLLGIVILGMTVGAITNPNEESLKAYFLNRLRNEAGALGGVTAAMADPLVQTKHESFLFFSLGRCELMKREEPSFFLGCLGSWYPIKSPYE